MVVMVVVVAVIGVGGYRVDGRCPFVVAWALDVLDIPLVVAVVVDASGHGHCADAGGGRHHH